MLEKSERQIKRWIRAILKARFPPKPAIFCRLRRKFMDQIQIYRPGSAPIGSCKIKTLNFQFSPHLRVVTRVTAAVICKPFSHRQPIIRPHRDWWQQLERWTGRAHASTTILVAVGDQWRLGRDWNFVSSFHVLKKPPNHAGQGVPINNKSYREKKKSRAVLIGQLHTRTRWSSKLASGRWRSILFPVAGRVNNSQVT